MYCLLYYTLTYLQYASALTVQDRLHARSSCCHVQAVEAPPLPCFVAWATEADHPGRSLVDHTIEPVVRIHYSYFAIAAYGKVLYENKADSGLMALCHYSTA